MSTKPNIIPDPVVQQADWLYRSGKFEQAVKLYKKALLRFPSNQDILTDLGTALLQLGHMDQGLKVLGKSMKVAPNHAKAFFNHAVGLRKQKRYSEALADYDRVIALDPASAEAYSGRGSMLESFRRFDEAMATYDLAIARIPDSAQGYWNKALLSLLLGNFEEGWPLYEWRKRAFSRDFRRGFTQPLWLGEQALSGKVILIYAEQGLGDFIQYSRYVPVLESIGARVILETPASLVSVLSTLKTGCTIIAQGKPLPEFDFHCPVMSLPLAFRTSGANIPATVPYLYADPDKQAEWHKSMGSKSKPRIGLVWSGSPKHKDDLNRSIPFELLAPLWELPIEFHVAQKEIHPDDLPRLQAIPQVQLHNTELHDFSDTAALIGEMDAVVSVDTSVAHLAGALGKPVCVLLPFIPDYRWMLDRNDSSWYPTATLFRQPGIEDWQSVMADVCHYLARIK